MLIKFFKRGTGSGSGAIDYLTRKTDLKTKKLRQPAPEIIRGSAKLTARLIDELKFEQKYSSGVLSFAPEDAPTEKEQQELIDNFEAIAFAGILEANRNIAWIRHQHTGSNRVELHFISPKVELSTRLSLNIAPPGWQNYFQPWQSKWNLQKGWASPNDPNRARVSSPGYTAFDANKKNNNNPKNTRARATAAVEKAIANGEATDRTGVLKALQDNGYEILRATNKSITIKDPNWTGDPTATKARIRLKSQTFYSNWTLENQLNPPLIDTAKEVAKLEAEIKEKVGKRKKFNQDYYSQTPQVNEFPIPKKFTSLPEMLVESLGERAIVSPKTFDLAVARRKARKAELENFKANIDLVNLALSQGFTKNVKKSSTNSIRLEHSNGSKIIVKPGNHDVYFSSVNSNKSGTVVDFVQNQLGYSNLGSARKFMRESLLQPAFKKPIQQEIQPKMQSAMEIIARSMPPELKQQFSQKNKPKPKPKKLLQHNSYLENDRQISPIIFQSDRFSGQILIDEWNNAVFPYRDGEIITGYELINTAFKGFEPGGKKTLWRSNQKLSDDRLIITESPIDALSFQQLHGRENDRFIATGGIFSKHQEQLIQSQIMNILEHQGRVGKIIIATDNDEAGAKLAKQISDLVPQKYYWSKKIKKPKLKDWNQDLIAKIVKDKNQKARSKNSQYKSKGFER